MTHPEMTQTQLLTKALVLSSIARIDEQSAKAAKLANWLTGGLNAARVEACKLLQCRCQKKILVA